MMTALGIINTHLQLGHDLLVAHHRQATLAQLISQQNDTQAVGFNQLLQVLKSQERTFHI
jgi:hypothetical protein